MLVLYLCLLDLPRKGKLFYSQWYVVEFFYLLFGLFVALNFLFKRLKPSTPRMVRPPYWQVLANPKSMNHSAPLAPVLMGRSICAKERM